MSMCVGALKMKTRVESLQKNNNNEPIFQQTKFSVLDLGLTDRRNLTGTWPKSACGKSSSCRFSFSAARRSVFLFVFRFPSLFTPLLERDYYFENKVCNKFL